MSIQLVTQDDHERAHLRIVEPLASVRWRGVTATLMVSAIQHTRWVTRSAAEAGGRCQSGYARNECSIHAAFWWISWRVVASPAVGSSAAAWATTMTAAAAAARVS